MMLTFLIDILKKKHFNPKNVQSLYDLNGICMVTDRGTAIAPNHRYFALTATMEVVRPFVYTRDNKKEMKSQKIAYVYITLVM